MSVAVLDIGSTNLKIALVGADGTILHSRTRPTPHVVGPPYRHIDVETVWRWLIDSLAELSAEAGIDAIVTASHGSSAALLDADRRLVVPLMYYEAEPPEPVRRAYAQIAPPFEEVFAPTNPGALTLARQIFWIETAFPEAFARIDTILPYAQFWTMRLSGVAASEATALGAQTHLWNPLARDFSRLAIDRGWAARFPPLQPAWSVVGGLLPDIAAATGIPAGTPILCGVHDSNANYARYRAGGFDDFTLMSTGTWLIVFNAGGALEALDPRRDAVSNTDVTGRPVACSRFMAGREWAELAGAAADITPEVADAAALVATGCMALPSFTDSGGPFPGTGGRGRIVGPAPSGPAARAALATLYAALMSAAALDVAGSRNRLIIDGPFARNALFCGLIAALRPGQQVDVSTARDGTILGAAALSRWPEGAAVAAVALDPVAALDLPGLDRYAADWTEAARAHAG